MNAQRHACHQRAVSVAGVPAAFCIRPRRPLPHGRRAVAAAVAALEADPASDICELPRHKSPKPLDQQKWTHMKRGIHEDGGVLVVSCADSRSSKAEKQQQLIDLLIKDAQMRRRLPKVLADKAARRSPPVRVMAVTEEDQHEAVRMMAAASKRVHQQLNSQADPKPTSKSRNSSARSSSSSSGGGEAGDTSSSSSSSSRPHRPALARVAWQPVPANAALADALDVPTGTVLYYMTPALIAPVVWAHMSRPQRHLFTARDSSQVQTLQSKILRQLDASRQEYMLVRCLGPQGLVVLSKVLAYLRRSLKEAEWWEGGDMAAVLLADFPATARSSSSGSSSSGDDSTEAAAQQQGGGDRPPVRAEDKVYLVALMRCVAKQPWALDVLVPDKPTQQESSMQAGNPWAQAK